MGVFRRILSLMLSLVMIASMGTALVFAEGAAGQALGASGWFKTGQSPVGVTHLDYDGIGNPDLPKVAVRLNDRFITADWETDFTVNPAGAIKLLKNNNGNTNSEDSSPYSELLLRPTQNGDITITHNKSGLVLPITAKNVTNTPSKTGIRIDLVAGKAADAGGQTLSGGGRIEGVSATSGASAVVPICFQIFEDGNPMPIKGGEPSGKINIDDPKIKYTTSGSPDTFTVYKLTNGENMLRYKVDTLGEFTLIFDVTYEGKTYKTAPFTLKLVPAKKDVVITVEPGASINTELDKLRTGKSIDFANNNYIIQLKEGTYAHTNDATLTLDIPVIIAGVGRNPENHPTIVKSSIIVNMPVGQPAVLEQFVLEGRKSKEGTGITTALTDQGQVQGGITVKGFEIGVDVIDRPIPVCDNIQNCKIGMSVVVLKPDSVSVSRGGAFENNDIAVHIKDESKTVGGQTTTNPFSFAMQYKNFIGNKVNIQNDSSIPFNFSFNYFDDVRTGKFTTGDSVSTLPLCSPYYAEIVKDYANPPTNMKIMGDELTKVQVNTEVLNANTTIDQSNFTVGTKISLVKPGESVETLSGWNFTSISGGTTPAFKPAIDTTKLVGGSAAATGKLPGGTKYQPVSFSHHGALPGTASVSVKPTETVTGTLRLYKVVGNGLELQKDAVTVNKNGEYVFNRDSASDYIITGTEVNVPNTEGSGGSTGNTGSGSNDYTGSEEAGKQLANTPAGGTATLDISSKPIVGISVFQELGNNPGKTLLLMGDGYAWHIASNTLRTVPGLYMVNTTISGTSPNAAQLKKLAGGAVFQSLYFSFHGQLPFVASIEVAVDSKLNGKRLNLYHSIKNNTQLMLVQSGIEVKDGKAMLTGIGSCSDYILTADTIPGALVGTASTSMVNPNTGARDVAPLAMAIALLSGLGAVLLLSDNKKKK